jgi:hypothetical protein
VSHVGRSSIEAERNRVYWFSGKGPEVAECRGRLRFVSNFREIYAPHKRYKVGQVRGGGAEADTKAAPAHRSPARPGHL